MNQSFIYDKEKRQQWQSSLCMIPVLLGLLKEKFDKFDPKGYDRSIPTIISAYQDIYRTWEQSSNLNPIQNRWVKEIGNYLEAVQKTLVHSDKKLLNITSQVSRS